MILDPHKYRELIEAALPAEMFDADTLPPSSRTLFTPRGHRDALMPDKTIVEGGRGVGKTYWTQCLLNERLRATAARELSLPALTELQVSPGFGAEFNSASYPSAGQLGELLESRHDPRDVWLAVVLNALADQAVRSAPTWSAKVDLVKSSQGRAELGLEQANRQLRDDGRTHLVVFDALDHLHRDRQQTDRLVRGMLEVATMLRLSTRNIRVKVFIRPDMISDRIFQFTDASKLASRASLRWTPTNLYGLFFHYLGNADSEWAESFRATADEWVPADDGRWVTPTSYANDAIKQQDLFVQIAGEFMGANYRKGRTYTWLPNHLMDGTEQVSPRSFLAALSRAVQTTGNEHDAHPYAIHHEGLRRGVQFASEIRVKEIGEDIPWVRTLAAPLEGLQVPIEPDAVISAWKEKGIGADLLATSSVDSPRTGPTDPHRPQRLVEDLVELGVMRRRTDGRLDMPDVYRIAFRIGRKGGVPKLKRPA